MSSGATCVRACVLTWGEADVGDGVAAMVEAQQILQRVGVHHQDAAVAQAHCQRLPVGREGAAAAAWRTHTSTVSQSSVSQSSVSHQSSVSQS